MTEITKSTEAKKDEMQVEKEKLESVKRADAAVKTMHDFTSPEVLYKELINSVLKYHPSTDISMIEKAYKVASEAHEGQKRKSGEPYICLLYTSDAADEEDSVDLSSRRIIKKKKRHN